MSNQLFKQNIPQNILTDLLNEICVKKDNYYVLDRIAFKKAEYYDLIDKLTNKLKEYYHNSKQFYLIRKLTYNNFLTIIRQLCKYLNITYKTKISYCKSIYHNTLYIYIN